MNLLGIIFDPFHATVHKIWRVGDDEHVESVQVFRVKGSGLPCIRIDDWMTSFRWLKSFKAKDFPLPPYIVEMIGTKQPAEQPLTTKAKQLTNITRITEAHPSPVIALHLLGQLSGTAASACTRPLLFA